MGIGLVNEKNYWVFVPGRPDFSSRHESAKKALATAERWRDRGLCPKVKVLPLRFGEGNYGECNSES